MSNENGDAQMTVGANITPYQQKMAQVTAIAKQTGEKIGLEGLKGERALHGQITGFFKDIGSGANVAESAMNRLGESFKMGAGTLVALAAVQYLFGAMQKGVEIAGKFRDAVKDSLSISSDNSSKSVEQMGDEIARLKQNAKDTDLAAMTNLEAGAAVVAQAFEKGESISKVIVEDAKEHLAIVQQEHAEEDSMASQAIDQQNDILRLKIAGHDEEAEAAQDEFADRNKMLELQKKGDQDAIDALNDQIALKKQLRDVARNKAEDKESVTLKDQIDAEKARQAETGKTAEQKLADATAKVNADRAKLAATAAANTPHSFQDVIDREESDIHNDTSDKTRAIDAQKAQLTLQKDIGAQKDVQAGIDTKVADINAEAAKDEQKSAFDQLSTLGKIAALQDQIAAAKKVQGDPNSTAMQKAQARLSIGQYRDSLIPLQKEAADASKEQSEEVTRELVKQAELKSEIAKEGMTGEQKVAALRKKILDEQNSESAFVGPKTQLEIAKEHTQVLEDQLELTKQINENGKKKGGLSGRAGRKIHFSTDDLMASTAGELGPRLSYTSDLQSRLGYFNKNLDFHASKPDTGHAGTTKAVGGLGGKLDAVHGQLVILNEKIGGVA